MNDVKILGETADLLFKNRSIYTATVSIFRDAMIYKNHRPAGGQESNKRQLPSQAEDSMAKPSLHLAVFAKPTWLRVSRGLQKLAFEIAATNL